MDGNMRMILNLYQFTLFWDFVCSVLAMFVHRTEEEAYLRGRGFIPNLQNINFNPAKSGQKLNFSFENFSLAFLREEISSSRDCIESKFNSTCKLLAYPNTRREKLFISAISTTREHDGENSHFRFLWNFHCFHDSCSFLTCITKADLTFFPQSQVGRRGQSKEKAKERKRDEIKSKRLLLKDESEKRREEWERETTGRQWRMK